MGIVEFEDVTFRYEELDEPIFEHLSISLPSGIVSLLGQNATGKSTFLLLAGGTLVPESGSVSIMGVDTVLLRDETERQRYVSFIFQNMEFETEQTIENLLPYIYETGFHTDRDAGFIESLIDMFDLEKCLNKRTQEISKGELQRTILVFSLLYGSKILIMDEPIFAMEDHQKYGAMKYLTDYAKKKDISIFYSVHELEISEKYSEHLLLFHKSGAIQLGPRRELFNRDTIEKAYEVPFHMLKLKETLYRETLIAANPHN